VPHAAAAAPAGLAAPLFALWLAGAVFMGALQLVRLVRFHGQVGRGRPAPGWLVEEVRALATLVRVRPPAARVLPGLVSPVVWGLGRPLLLWPAALLDGLPAESRRAATVHELAHLRRRDHWVGWLQLAASCLWWWNPVFWHVRRQLGRAAELACDAWVVETLPRARRAYAEALLGVCELSSRHAAPVPAVGIGGEREELERRLTMIMREKVPCRLPVRALVGVGLLALVVLPGWSLGQRPAEPAAFQDTTQPATSQLGRTGNAPQGTTTAAPDREQRLRKLEASLEALLKEVKELRGEAGKPAGATQGQPQEKPTQGTHGWSVYETLGQPRHAVTSYWAVTDTEGGQPMHLTRVTYKMLKDKADALAAFLRDVKTPVLETKVEGEGIVVTTTPEAQQVIGQFIGLLQGKTGGHRTERNYYAPQKQ
jgi:beta-lactamase regulating signal transducer with metallopeptidase domain